MQILACATCIIFSKNGDKIASHVIFDQTYVHYFMLILYISSSFGEAPHSRTMLEISVLPVERAIFFPMHGVTLHLRPQFTGCSCQLPDRV